MCLFPRKIRTPFNRLARQGGQPLFIEVPCNKCAECKKSMRLQWHFRTYHESLACVSAGGFIYYDTLTYADEHLPKLSNFYDISDKNIRDFSCFDHTHFRYFLKRLRRQLDYYHKGVCFKYFLTSEYGTDERYTHRPHYHILFFVYPPEKGKNIHPYRFSRFVSKNWQYGRTDGLPFKPIDYVSKNIFGSNYTIERNTNYLRVCSYVSKYITKDSDFQKTIDNRISVLSQYLNDDELKKLIRNINMFHRQSQGFGISYLSTLTKDEFRYIFNTGSCRIIDDKKVVCTIPIPLYFKRKLFYQLHKNTNNEKVQFTWIPTPQGEEYIRHRYRSNISYACKQIKENIANLSSCDQLAVHKLLAGRTIEDLSIYNLFYRGFSRELNYLSYYINSMSLPHTLTDTEYNLHDWLETIISSKYACKFDKEDYYPIDKDNNTITVPDYDMLYSETNYNYNQHIKKLAYDENSCFSFRDFDKINNILKTHTKNLSSAKEEYFQYKENLEKRFKYLFKYE